MKIHLAGMTERVAALYLRHLGHEMADRQSANIIIDCSKLITYDQVIARINGALIWDEIK